MSYFSYLSTRVLRGTQRGFPRIFQARRSWGPRSGSLLTVDSTLRMIYDCHALTPLLIRATVKKEILLLSSCNVKHTVDPIKMLLPLVDKQYYC